MPTPSELKRVKDAANGPEYFVVHEVVECVSETEEGFGEEDLPRPVEVKVGLEHARKITQSAFDDVVQETMDEFEIDEASAIAEATKLLEMQGVCLVDIDIRIRRDR